jgi:hypothetical protein
MRLPTATSDGRRVFQTCELTRSECPVVLWRISAFWRSVLSRTTSPQLEDHSMGNSTVVKATVIGTVLQVLMVVCGHYVPQIAALFPVMGTLIGGITGWLATSTTPRLTAGAAAGSGLVSGVVAGTLGTLVSVFLGDVPMSTVGIAAASTAVLGAVGGLLGRMMAARSATA